MKKALTILSFGIAVAVNAQWSTYDVSNSNISTNGGQRVVVDQSTGDIFIGTLAGFNIKSGSNWALHDMNSGALGNNAALLSMRDASNNIWVTTDGGGVSRYNGLTWTTFNTGNSNISDNRVYTVKQSPSGVIWFGTRDGGLSSYNGSGFNYVSISGNVTVSYDRVMSMDIDANGVIWIGSAGGGLVKYNPNTNQWAQYNTTNSTILHNDVYQVSIAPDGMIWAGTYGGVSIFNPNTTSFISHLSSSNTMMSNNYIRGISFDNLGRGYVAMAYGGVARVETNYTISTIWTSSNSDLASDTVWHLNYGGGKVWVATLNEGVCAMDIDVSVQENQLVPFDISVSPNPVTDNAMLSITSGVDRKTVISLYTESGKLVWTSNAQVHANFENRYSIPLAQHAKGIYLITVTDENGLKKTINIVHE